MKYIGLLYGKERSFPDALIECINKIKLDEIKAEKIEFGTIEIVHQFPYSLIFDRVSFEVPFYNSILKSAYIKGVNVINNPFINANMDNFFFNSLAYTLGLNIPKTVILPSKEKPEGTTSDTMSNLIYPLDWEKVFDYVGFPAYLKSCSGNFSFNEYRVYNPQEFFSAYDLTGKNTMILQEELNCETYYIAYVINKNNVKIIEYNPRNPFHLRYNKNGTSLLQVQKSKIEDICIRISNALNLDFNAIEFAINDGEPYILEFLSNSIIENSYMNPNDFQWLVDTTAQLLIEKVKSKFEPNSLNIIEK